MVHSDPAPCGDRRFASSGDVIEIINMVFVKTTKENVLSQPSGVKFAVPVGYLRDLLSKME